MAKASRASTASAARPGASNSRRSSPSEPPAAAPDSLDEPTTGLHVHDVAKLMEALHELVEQGNSVVVIEHNLEVVKTADWVIDMCPEGGGGVVVAEGTPEEIVRAGKWHTARFLKEVLERRQIKGGRERQAAE